MVVPKKTQKLGVRDEGCMQARQHAYGHTKTTQVTPTLSFYT